VINSIRIKNFQSLHDVNVELGKLTVIVGASSSGKSAFTRALKAVASNQLDSDYITQGTKKAAVSVRTDTHTVTIERETNASSTYKVAALGGKESSYTKLNRQVPTEITSILGITPSTKEVDSINFAGQFDAPYLLKDGASNVARILGELTNVSTIFEAVKKANGKVKVASGVLNLRKKDLDQVTTQLKGYGSLPKQAKAIAEAELKLETAKDLDRQLAELGRVVANADRASEALVGFKEIADEPEIGPLLDAHKKLENFKSLVRAAALSVKEIAKLSASIEEQDSAIITAEEELHQVLVDAGTCPLCEQKVS
jgi:DNA repair ATPase RecN